MLELLRTGTAQEIVQEVIDNYLPKYREKGICKGEAVFASCLYYRPTDGHVCVIGHFADGLLNGEYGPIDHHCTKLGIPYHSNRMYFLKQLQQLHDHNELLDLERLQRLAERYEGAF